MRMVLINVPKNRALALEKFLKKNTAVVKVIKQDVEVLEVSRKNTKIPKSSVAKHYEVYLRGSGKQAYAFVDSLFEKKLVPAGRKWMVFVIDQARALNTRRVRRHKRAA